MNLTIKGGKGGDFEPDNWKSFSLLMFSGKIWNCTPPVVSFVGPGNLAPPLPPLTRDPSSAPATGAHKGTRTGRPKRPWQTYHFVKKRI